MNATPHLPCVAAVRTLFMNVKEGLGLGFYDNSDWKTKIPKEYHMFAGDYHRFAGKHRPYQFYFKMCGDWPEWFVKMGPPFGTLEEEDAEKDSPHVPGETDRKRKVSYC